MVPAHALLGNEAASQGSRQQGWQGWEYSVDASGGGRIDALGLDRHAAPVVLEFKRTVSGLPICQGLFHFDYHREVFAEIVLRRCGDRMASKIRWSATRLYCIAEEIGPREEAVARQIGRRVEVLQLRRYTRGVVTIQTPRPPEIQ